MRKPDSNPMDVAKLLDRIPEIYHPRIMLHRFPELLKDYKLVGYHHFSGEKLIDCQGLRSRSLHKLDELRDTEEPLDYCFFGPVYESISKKGYLPKVQLPELGGVLYNFKKSKSQKPLVYALGGIRRRKIPELFNLGFDGVALLGSIWGKKDPVAAFEKYQYIERSVWAKKRKKRAYYTGLSPRMNRNGLNDSSLICITRDDPSLNHFEQVKIFVNAGARLIQLRSKFLSPNELYEQAKPAAELTKKHDCQLIINDHYQLVSDIDADGVHLGMNDAPVEYVRRVLSPEKIIGKTVHSIPEARQSITDKPDYIGLGPYRQSSTKKELCPVLSDDDFFSVLDILHPTPVF